MDNNEENSDFVIIENTQNSRNEYGHRYGSEIFTITEKDIKALLSGKQLACDINGGEYALFIIMDNLENTDCDFKCLKEK